jgi:hypothetical protein
MFEILDDVFVLIINPIPRVWIQSCYRNLRQCSVLSEAPQDHQNQVGFLEVWCTLGPNLDIPTSFPIIRQSSIHDSQK